MRHRYAHYSLLWQLPPTVARPQHQYTLFERYVAVLRIMGLDQGRCPADRYSRRHTPSASTTDADATSRDAEPQRTGSVHEGTVPLEGVETDTSGVNFPRANSEDMAKPSISSSASTAAVSTPVFQSSRLNSSPSETKSIGAGSSHTLQAKRISTGSSKSGTRPAGSKESNTCQKKY